MNNKLLNQMRKIVNRYDPIRLYCVTNDFSEYDQEIKEIYKRFKKCNNLDEFIIEVHKVFKKWFSTYAAGKKEKYIELSEDLFRLLNKMNSKK